MMVPSHVENARACALRALKKSNGGGGLAGWVIRRALAWFRRRLKKSSDLEEISSLCEVLISILTFLKGATWIREKYTPTIELALKSLQELRGMTVGGQ